MADRIRVLLCDDVAMLRELLRYELEEDDDVVVVGEADNGLDGVRLVEELHPNVVVLDLAMPGIDGLEAITRMLAVPEPPAILVHSGFDADGMRERVLALGAARYLEKGGNLREVRTAVRELMDRPQP
ncbi:MAG TPA: response regulator transcription factor [Thermoleophilaceae bacterium]|jgi:DNA-binding NarL/FixJ family response regulator|nr:response regulator transcription factor [Thermoleophilaceae bacterium]